MSPRQSHWYDRNEQRNYPLINESDLPDGLVADLTLRFPSNLGEKAALVSATATDRLVTLMFAIIDPAGGFIPLATLTESRPVDLGRPLPLEPQSEGVSGWVALGRGADTIRCSVSLPGSKGELAPRAARPYEVPGILSVAKLDSDAILQGDVRLEAQSPMVIRQGVIDLNGTDQEAIIFEIDANQVGADGTLGGESLLQELLGPCGARADNDSCQGSAIKSIEGVTPNCDGEITVVLYGCAEVQEVENMCGAQVVCRTDLNTLCPEDDLPDLDGNLNPSPTDECDVIESEVDPETSIYARSGLSPSPEPLFKPVMRMPFKVTFDEERIGDMWVVSGRAGFESTDVDENAEDPIRNLVDVDFGSSATSEPFVPILGEWTLFGDYYTGQSVQNRPALSVIPIGSSLPPAFAIGARTAVPVDGISGVVFDFQDAYNYRFAGVAGGPRRWVSGSVSRGFATIETEAPMAENASTRMRVRIDRNVVQIYEMPSRTLRLSQTLIDAPARTHLGVMSLSDGPIEWFGSYTVGVELVDELDLASISLAPKPIPGDPFVSFYRPTDTAVARNAELAVKFESTDSASERNLAILFRREAPETLKGEGENLVSAEIDQTNSEIRIRRKQNGTWSTLGTTSISLPLEAWITVSLTVTSTNASLAVSGPVSGSIGPVTIPDPSGTLSWGLKATNASPRIAYFHIEEPA